MNNRVHPIDNAQLDTAPNRNVDVEKANYNREEQKNTLLPSNSLEDSQKLYQQFERERKLYNQCFDKIFESRVIEQLGGISPRQEKMKVFQETMAIFKDIANILFRISETVKLIVFEKDDLLLTQNGKFEEHISDVIIKEVKDMDARYRDFLQGSSFRYIDSVAEVNEIKPEQYECIYYNTKEWSNQIIQGIVQNLPAASTKRMNSASTNMDKQQDGGKSKNDPGCFESFCCCFSSQKDNKEKEKMKSMTMRDSEQAKNNNQAIED